jgi:hypothetical protein
MAEAFNEEKWFNLATTASRPGRIEISYERLEWFRRKLNWGHRYIGVGRVPRERWAIHLRKGLAEPALVMRTKPLTVAVYTDEFDCVAMLRFTTIPAGENVREGDRLLAVNTFERMPENGPRLARDLVRGPGNASQWFSVHPVIADFLSDDAEAIAARKREISEFEWTRASELSFAYRKRFPRRLRDGNPYLSHLEAK